MEPQINEQFDFFKEIEKIQNNSSSLFLKIWKMFLMTQYSSIKVLSHLCRYFPIIISVSVFLAMLTFGGNKIYKEHKNYQRQQIEAIKEININEFIAIQTNINKHKEAEIKKIVELYWVASFLKEQGNFLSTKKINSTIQERMADINKFYDSRLFEMTQSYDFINKDRTDLIKHTHDDYDPLEKIINWRTLTKTGAIKFQSETIELNKEWMTHVKEPLKLSEYLATKKTLIDSGKIF